MTYKEYIKKAVTTATHDTREKALSCFGFGLLGEWVEVQTKIIDNDRPAAIKKELGDFIWYVGNLAHKLGITPKRGFHNYTSVNVYHTIGTLQEHMKKVYRDKDYDFSEKDLKKMQYLLDILYGAWYALVKEMGYTTSEIFKMNIDKLFSRKKRNVIHGEGDDR